jgi:hypothetical protein
MLDIREFSNINRGVNTYNILSGRHKEICALDVLDSNRKVTVKEITVV